MSEIIKEQVIKAINRVMVLSPDRILPESKFVADLGCDSLDSVEIAMEIEDETLIDVDDDEASKWVTVQDAIDYVTKQKGLTQPPINVQG